MLCIKNIILFSVTVFFSSACLCQVSKTIDTLISKHLQTRTVVLTDADHDGIADQFDNEKNTPAGCAVDTHGVALDTDGDGVPDCRDKEKLTKQECFSVDSNGTGFCPTPNRGIIDDFSCYMSMRSFDFNSSYKKLSKEQEVILDSVAIDMMNNPNCHATIQGYFIAGNKLSKQITTQHIQNILIYLTNIKEIDGSRFKTSVKEGTYINRVHIIPNL